MVWTGQNTSGAAELLAGALQVYKRALVVGSQTAGNPHLQTVRGHFRGKEALVTTIVDSYLPDGSSIKVKGIRPDLVLRDSNEIALPRSMADPIDQVPPFFNDYASTIKSGPFEEAKRAADQKLKTERPDDLETAVIGIALVVEGF